MHLAPCYLFISPTTGEASPLPRPRDSISTQGVNLFAALALDDAFHLVKLRMLLHELSV